MYKLKDLLKDLEGFDLEAEVEMDGKAILIHNPTEIDGAYDWYISKYIDCPEDSDYQK